MKWVWVQSMFHIAKEQEITQIRSPKISQTKRKLNNANKIFFYWEKDFNLPCPQEFQMRSQILIKAEIGK